MVVRQGEVSKRKPLILFVTVAAGGSHVSSAEAMKEALEANYPGRFEIEITEPMKSYGFEAFDGRHKRAWRWALAHPWAVVWGQRLIDALPRPSMALQRRMLRSFAARAAAELSAHPPDLIVANHGWLTTALSMGQRRYGLRVPVVTFQTSALQPTALWADEDAERIVVGSDAARDYLRKLGANADRIDVLGYPVRQAFLKAPAKREARQRLGLEDRFTCLISLGGEGVGGRPLEVVACLRSLGERLQIVVITGRNEALLRSLERASERDPMLKAKGFVTNMADYVAACDLIIGKTGPAVVMEALAVGRPVLAPYRSGGVENRVIEFLEAHQVGGYAPCSEGLLRAVLRFREEPERLDAVWARAAAFDFPGMAERFAAYLAHYAQTGRPDISLTGRGLFWPQARRAALLQS